MRRLLCAFPFAVALVVAGLWPSAAGGQPQRLPYAEAGLSDRAAAAHLLSRFTYGARPGEVDHVLAVGLEPWLEGQLRADLPDDALDRRLAPLAALALDGEALSQTYPGDGVVRAMALRDSVLTPEDLAADDRQALRNKVDAYMAERGYRSERELVRDLLSQKLLRATYSENQLHEVLVDFWFNHFNVALQDGRVRTYLFSYERDAIRPHVLGTFRDLLGATARHPAMLYYLDNARSSAPDSVTTTLDYMLSQQDATGRRSPQRLDRFVERRRQRQRERMAGSAGNALRRVPGINENYARELMELHTLGVDGGYTQADVVDVARAFTGWTAVPPGTAGEQLRARNTRKTGLVLDGDFMFHPGAHDATAKTILGTPFPAGGGLDEGHRVLDLLAAHPATARHLAHKLAVRFVSDTPPPAVVDHLAGVFTATGGDITAVVRALAYHDAFWSAEARYAKIKSPLELTVSMLRALDADLRRAPRLAQEIEQMGQPLYRYLAPTGFPDRGDAWINSGTLVNRMNFAMRLATGGVPGVRVDVRALNDRREPPSIEAALATYVPLLLPERDAGATLDRLLPLAQDPAFADRLATAGPGEGEADGAAFREADPLARVVGVILGAPAFQRR